MKVPDKLGKSFWFDLPVRDMLDAMSFYEGLLGWTFLKLSNPVLPNYYVIQAGDQAIGGLRQMTGQNIKKAESDAPIPYFTVAELAPAVQRAKDLGASLIGQRIDMGENNGSYQWLRDRENNLIALWAPH